MGIELWSWIFAFGVVFALGGIAAIFSESEPLNDRSGGVVIPVSYLPTYHNLEPGVYSAVLIRQSGNVRTDLGAFLTPEGALSAAVEPFRRANVEQIRVVHSSSTQLSAYRRFYHMRGTKEGRKLGGVQVIRLRDLTEEEVGWLNPVTGLKPSTPKDLSDSYLKSLIKRADLDEVLAAEAEARVAGAIKYPAPTLEELLKRGVSPLKAWREVRDMSVSELAEVTKIPPRFLTQFENQTRNPTREQIRLLAEALAISPSDIRFKPES